MCRSHKVEITLHKKYIRIDMPYIYIYFYDSLKYNYILYVKMYGI